MIEMIKQGNSLTNNKKQRKPQSGYKYIYKYYMLDIFYMYWIIGNLISEINFKLGFQDVMDSKGSQKSCSQFLSKDICMFECMVYGISIGFN